MYPKAELLFPPRLISSLRDLRGPDWALLVDRVAKLPETDADSLAFTLMMIRLDGCVKCHEGSFKYMRGCHLCATTMRCTSRRGIRTRQPSGVSSGVNSVLPGTRRNLFIDLSRNVTARS